MTRIKKKKKKYGATKNTFLLLFSHSSTVYTIIKNTRGNIAKYYPRSLVFSLSFLKIIIHPLLFHLCPSRRLRVQINFRDRETMKNRTTGRRRPGLGGINYVAFDPQRSLNRGGEDKTSAKLGRSNDSTLFSPSRLIRDPLS